MGREDDDGRLVADGHYEVRMTILDEMREEWDYETSVEALGFSSDTLSDQGRDQRRWQRRETQGEESMRTPTCSGSEYAVHDHTAGGIYDVRGPGRHGTHLRLPCGPAAYRSYGTCPRSELGEEDPIRDGLWRGAGNAFAEGTDESAAMQQYRLFVKTYGGSEHAASAQYMLAECYFASGDYETALQEYERVHKFKGDDKYIQASVLLRSAECQFNLHKFAAAVNTYDQLISKYEDSFLLAEGLYEAGRAYIANGNWLKLELSYKQLLEARPGYAKLPQVKFALGLFVNRDQNYEQALAYFKEVPNDRGLFYMGKTLEDMGQALLAIQRYRKVRLKYPDSPLRHDFVAFTASGSVLSQ